MQIKSSVAIFYCKRIDDNSFIHSIWLFNNLFELDFQGILKPRLQICKWSWQFANYPVLQFSIVKKSMLMNSFEFNLIFQ